MTLFKRLRQQVSFSTLALVAALATVVVVPARAAHEAELTSFDLHIQQQMEQMVIFYKQREMVGYHLQLLLLMEQLVQQMKHLIQPQTYFLLIVQQEIKFRTQIQS